MDKNLILLLIIIAVWFLVIRNLSPVTRTGNGSTGGAGASQSWATNTGSATTGAASGVGRSYTA